jgi:hypothetical protein
MRVRLEMPRHCECRFCFVKPPSRSLVCWFAGLLVFWVCSSAGLLASCMIPTSNQTRERTASVECTSAAVPCSPQHWCLVLANICF